MAELASALVGRREELAAFERALAEVERGEARAVALRGEPGIGKSRLLGELAGRARGRGLLVLEGRAAELERDLTFALLLDALEPLVSDGALARAIAELEGWQLRELAGVLPAVGPLVAVEWAPVSGERHRVARAVRALLERVAAERPLALLLDDVHWADPASADVLALLLYRPPRAGVLLGLAARPGRAPALESVLAGAVQRGIGDVLELGPLPLEAVGELLPGTGPVARERLYRESGGNPFYLQELARAGRSGLAGVGRTGLAGVPGAVQAALAGELAGLSAEGRRVLEGAAVAGDPFEPALAAVAAEVDETAAMACLDELLGADLVRATGQPGRFRFRHPLVRRAVYEGAGGGWRLAAHARAAAALAARGATPAQRAHHVERAARPDDLTAVDLLVAAAEEVDQAAPATAAGWYEAALRLLPESAEYRSHRLSLLRAQARALVSAGRPGDAREVLRRVLALLPPEAAAERVDATVMLAGLLTVWTQRPDEARRLLDAERAALGELGPAPRAALHLALAGERAEDGDHAASEVLADQAAAEARAAGDRALEAAAAGRAADAAHCRLRGDDPDALAAVDAKIAAAWELVEALPDDQAAQRLSMLVSLGIALKFTGRFSAARAAAERGLSLARGTGQGLFAPAFVTLRGFVDQELGRLDHAEAAQEEALESALLSGNLQVAYWASIASSWIAVARGDVDAALVHGQKAWELLGTRSYSQAGFSVADARLAAGDTRGALAALEAFDWVRPALWTFDRVKATEIAVRVLVALGRVEEAAERARCAPLEGGGRRTGVFGAITAHADATVLSAQGSAPEAARVALAGAAAADEGEAPLWAGRCRTLAGEALAACGRRDEARAELRAAAAELEARGAWGYRDAALRGLRRLGDRPRPSAAPELGGPARDGRLSALTAREREVAELVAEGQTNAQIAARLHLSESTVEKHVSRMLGKLGLSSRAGVVGLLARECLGAG
jgi:ATP/maltotriose-dependent transcriptional regulator MalT